MSHSSRVRVIHPTGFYSFASRKQCENLQSANKGHFEDAKTFKLYEKFAPRDTAAGEWKTKSTETGATLKYQTGPAFPVRQWERK